MYAEARCPDYLFLPASRLPSVSELSDLASKPAAPRNATAPDALTAPDAAMSPDAATPPGVIALGAVSCPRSTEPPLTPHACAVACLPAAAAGCVPPPLQALFAADGPLGAY